MKSISFATHVTAVFLFAIGALLGPSQVWAAQGAKSYIPLTRADIAACKKEISEAHRTEIRFAKAGAAETCQLFHIGSESCKSAEKYVRDNESQDDLDWFIEGSDHCESPQSACYGIKNYGANPEPWQLDAIKENAKLPDNNIDAREFDTTHMDKCLSKLWLDKQSRGSGSSKNISASNQTNGNALKANDDAEKRATSAQSAGSGNSIYTPRKPSSSPNARDSGTGGSSSQMPSGNASKSNSPAKNISSGGVTAPNVNHCVGVEKTNEEIHLFNKCSTATDIAHRGESQLNVAYCLIGTDAKGQLAECGGPRFAEWINGYTSDTAIYTGIREFGPRGLGMRVSRHRARRVAFLACQQPYHPSGVTFQNNGLKGTCMKCNSWAQDGKHTCISPTE